MSVEQLKFFLKNLPDNKSIMIRAKHGVGKSSVVKQVAEELGIGFHDVRLSQCDVSDIKGLPMLDRENKRTVFLKPYWFPRDEDSAGILFLDELNRASKDVLQAVFELCLDRRLDGDRLPSKWKIVSAVNADADYDVQELDPALADRWFMYSFDPPVTDWTKYARAKGFHDSVIEYIQTRPEHLDPPIGGDSSNYEAGEVYPSRRSWESFHECAVKLNLFEEPNDGQLMTLAKGWLGKGVAAAFVVYLTKEFARLRPSDILERLQDDDVLKKVEGACSDIESIATISNSLLGELDKRSKALSDRNAKNLKTFFCMLPLDVAARFWQELGGKRKKYNKFLTDCAQDKDFMKRLESVYLITGSKKAADPADATK
jgi:hypothetical protein